MEIGGLDPVIPFLLTALVSAVAFMTLTPRALAAGPTIFVGMDPAHGFDLVEHFRNPKNQKPFLAKLKSGAEKVYFQKLFAELPSSAERAVINGNVATFIDRKGRVLQIVVIQSPTLYAVNGRIVAIPADRATDIFAVGNELIAEKKTGSALFVRELVNEAAANGPQPKSFPLVFLYLGSAWTMQGSRTETPSQARPESSEFENQLPSEFVNLLKAGKGGKMPSHLACSATGHELSGGALDDFKWTARKRPGQDLVELSGGDHVIKIKIPRFNHQQSETEFNKVCVPPRKDMLERATATRHCAQSFQVLKKANAGFVNANALSSFEGAQICHKDGFNCEPFDQKRLEAFKREPPSKKRSWIEDIGASMLGSKESVVNEASHARLTGQRDSACGGGAPDPASPQPVSRECERLQEEVQRSENHMSVKLEPARRALVGSAQALLIAEELCKDPQFRAELQRRYGLESSAKGDKLNTGKK